MSLGRFDIPGVKGLVNIDCELCKAIDNTFKSKLFEVLYLHCSHLDRRLSDVLIGLDSTIGAMVRLPSTDSLYRLS
jgi:hypothetical protein